MSRAAKPSTNANVSSRVEMSFEIHGMNAQRGVWIGGAGVSTSAAPWKLHALAPSGPTSPPLPAAPSPEEQATSAPRTNAARDAPGWARRGTCHVYIGARPLTIRTHAL